jgi:hypothetical protein
MLEPMIEQFKSGLKENIDFWRGFLSEERIYEFNKIASLSATDFHFPVETWVKTVYDFSAAFNQTKDSDKQKIIESMSAL